VDWTFAFESYNSSILFILYPALLQLQYNKKLTLFVSFYSLVNWVIFIAVAYSMGADIHFDAMVGDTPIHGAVFLREVFLIIISTVFWYISYRNIPAIQKFDQKTAEQRRLIEQQADMQKGITLEIKDKMNNLLEQVDEQYKLIEQFNTRMQNQAATFEEISATLEELLGSAENISDSSVNQIDGNVRMETIVNEFKNIKVETKNKLVVTLDDMKSVVDLTNLGTEKLQTVEMTIEQIKNQSGKIAETVSIIVDIADKINLLSLNASIEAARAGEYGKGFAVVADEIGKLAFQTSESIKEIETVLSLSTRTTSEGVVVIQSTAEMIKGMINKMADSSDKIKVLQESIFVEEKYINIIIDQMFKNIQLAKSIGSSTDEQKNAIASTSKAIEHVNEVIAEMVGEMKELASSSGIILKNARDLMKRSEEAVIIDRKEE